uniref:T6SS effector BTH_I2691 family protein n=1 Tax=Halomonas sp. TaxID=1486246 RepID=UPI00260392C3|nr:T6SS effector BTH_I2691 family protein [Halomonas sp.]
MTFTIDPAAIAAAVEANSTVGTNDGDCPFCSRVGLPILPVRYAVVDRNKSAWNEDLPWQMASRVTDHCSVDPGPARYVLRLMREGFLYLYDEARQRWQAWMITTDSRLCEFPPKGEPPTANENEHVEAPCNIATNNISALLISIPDAQQAGIVHVAYSDHQWTNAMLDTMAANEDGIRDRVMQPFDVASWIADQSADSAMPPQDVSRFVPEYSGRPQEDLLEGDCFPYPGFRAQTFLDPEQLLERMNWIVRDAPELKDKGVVLAIDDPIGITASLNQFRNNAQRRLNDYVYDTDNVEKKMTSDIILGFREAIQNRRAEQVDTYLENGPEMPLFGHQRLADDFDALPEEQQQELWARFSNLERERIIRGREELAEDRAIDHRAHAIEQSWAKYLERYDETARDTFATEYKTDIDNKKATIDELAKVHSQWLLSTAVMDAMYSYDLQSLEDGVAYETAVAAMITGSSNTKDGDETIEALLDRPISDPDSLIWRAFYLNHEPAIEIATEYTAGDAVTWGRRVIGPLKTLLGIDSEKRTPLENLIADTTGVLAKKLGVVHATEITNNGIARLLHGISWGRYGSDLQILHFNANLGQLSNLYDSILWSNEVAVHAMRGNHTHAFPFMNLPGTQGSQPLWAFSTTELGADAMAAVQHNADLALEERRQSIKNAMTPGTWFGVFASSLEVFNVAMAWNQLGSNTSYTSQAERVSNFAASTAFLVSSLATTTSAIIYGAGEPKSPIYRAVTWGSAALVAVGYWTFSVWFFIKGVDARHNDDWAMSVIYFSSGGIFAAAGATSLAAAAQRVGVITGAEAMIGKFVISRAGWAMVASRLGWIGLALAILTVMIQKDALEEWLERCVFGTGAEKFESLQAALDKFYEISNQ